MMETVSAMLAETGTSVSYGQAHTVYRLSGELGYGNASEERERFYRWVQQSPAHTLALSLDGVTRCDTAGLAFLVEASRICRNAGKTLQILAIPQQIMQLSRFCGVESLLGTDATEASSNMGIG